MVNTGTTTTVLKIDTPEVSLSVNTYTSLDPTSFVAPTDTGGRFCAVSLTIFNVKISLAYNLFAETFQHIINLANNDINPVSGVNTTSIRNVVNSLGTTPKTQCNIKVDKTELIPTASLLLTWFRRYDTVTVGGRTRSHFSVPFSKNDATVTLDEIVDRFKSLFTGQGSIKAALIGDLGEATLTLGYGNQQSILSRVR